MNKILELENNAGESLSRWDSSNCWSKNRILHHSAEQWSAVKSWRSDDCSVECYQSTQPGLREAQNQDEEKSLFFPVSSLSLNAKSQVCILSAFWFSGRWGESFTMSYNFCSGETTTFWPLVRLPSHHNSVTHSLLNFSTTEITCCSGFCCRRTGWLWEICLFSYDGFSTCGTTKCLCRHN